MREIQSFEDFEKALKASKAPYMDPETIKTGVQKYAQSHKSKSLSRKLIPILIAIVVLSIGTAAFGDTLSNILFNKKGEKVYEYGIPLTRSVEENKAIAAEYDKYRSLIDKLQKDVKPGELSVLIITNAYEKGGSNRPIQAREPINNIDDIKNSTSTKFKTPVSDDITFNEGIITFKSVSQINVGSYFKIIDSKYKEAKDKGLDYIVWTEPLSSEASHIELKYTINNTSSPFSLTISREVAVGSNRISPDNVSKIEVGSEEVLYVHSATPEIIYVDSTGEKPLTYHFYLKSSSQKDTILSLIENMK